LLLVFAGLGFKVDGGFASCCDMVHHGATMDVDDRGCFDVPEIAWICMEMFCVFLWLQSISKCTMLV
jgi:hypothetical protein